MAVTPSNADSRLNSDQANSVTTGAGKELTCFLCKKKGHRLENCPHNPFNKDKNAEKANQVTTGNNKKKKDDENEDTCDLAFNTVTNNNYQLRERKTDIYDDEANNIVNPKNLIVNNNGTREDMMKYLWIADSGATCHMSCHDVGLYSYKKINTIVKVANGRVLSML